MMDGTIPTGSRIQNRTMGFSEATASYEAWLRKQTPVIEEDLRRKYQKMREGGVFTFLRGTFYRWTELWEANRKELRQTGVLIPKAPELFCVGDLHVENFGTWRDTEGRLIWGINDFDEAYPLRYLNDLVRLATSSYFALKEIKANWSFSHEAACAAILLGYQEGLAEGGKPFVLAQGLPWLWKIVTDPSRTPEQFWEKLNEKMKKPKGRGMRQVIKDAAHALKQCAPDDPTLRAMPLMTRQAGVGSLGRPRFVQRFEGRSGQILREAKKIAPSACVFAGFGKSINDAYRKILRSAVRVPDPFFAVVNDWSVRRLAFDSDKIDLQSLETIEAVQSFFRAMGAETANIHLGSANTRAVERHVKAQLSANPRWLVQAAEAMVKATEADFNELKKTDLGS